jgi:hypothetical protein
VASHRRPRKSRPDPPAGRAGQPGPPGPCAASAAIPARRLHPEAVQPPSYLGNLPASSRINNGIASLAGPMNRVGDGPGPHRTRTPSSRSDRVRQPLTLSVKGQKVCGQRCPQRRSLRTSMGLSWAPAGRRAASADSTEARGGHLLTAHRSTPEHAASERASGVTQPPGPDAAVAPRPERGRRIYRTVR